MNMTAFELLVALDMAKMSMLIHNGIIIVGVSDLHFQGCEDRREDRREEGSKHAFPP